MNVLLSIPMDVYRLREARCESKSPEYRMLTSGVIQGDRVVDRCDSDHAKRLRAWADECSAGAGQRITGSAAAETN